MKKILTELSGYGHYGICSLVCREDIPQIMERMAILKEKHPNFLRDKSWERPDFVYDPWGRTGLDASLNVLTKDDEGEYIRLGWVPSKINMAIESISLLQFCARIDEPTVEPCSLEVLPNKGENTYYLQGNLGDRIWDIIESPAFPKMIPAINKNILKWWEDQYNDREYGQLTTVDENEQGVYFHVLQPHGNGLWVDGARRLRHGAMNQITDHNTDTAYQAFLHVLSLCIILDHCRKEIERKNRCKSITARYDPIV